MLSSMPVVQVPTDEVLDLKLERFCAATGLSADQVMRLALAESEHLSNRIRLEAMIEYLADGGS